MPKPDTVSCHMPNCTVEPGPVTQTAPSPFCSPHSACADSTMQYSDSIHKIILIANILHITPAASCTAIPSHIHVALLPAAVFCRCAPQQCQALCAGEGSQVREGSWSQKEPWLQGISCWIGIGWWYACIVCNMPAVIALIGSLGRL